MNRVTQFLELLFFFTILGFITACQTESLQIVPDNDSFSTTGISRIKIENYVNRLFIDLIGREPTDEEQTLEANVLNESHLSKEVRLNLINRLMTDTNYSPNEGSYQEAFSNNLYFLAKIRCLEGVSDGDIRFKLGPLYHGLYQDSIEEKWDSYYEKQNKIRRYELILNSAHDLQQGVIKYHEVFAYMIDNGIYDEFNMNAFNFIRASFDQLLFRLPTAQEYDQAFNMVEYGITDQLLGEIGNSKEDYVNIIIASDAMKEGMIKWAYQVFLQRPGTPAEIASQLQNYLIDEDINKVIANILITDEYANFY